jgi:transcription initiation factor TFIIIB Brf1 subunit/transcription initiation factor TFIIB
MTEEATCPKCGSADWNAETDEGAWPSCNDCGFVQYDEWTLSIQREVKQEQAECKRVLGYVPDYPEAVKLGLAK